MNALNGAFDLHRSAPEGKSVPVTAAHGASATPAARAVTLAVVVVGIAAAVLMPENKPPLRPADGFVLLTGFYVAAQAIERLLELLPAGLGSTQAKANRAVVFPAIGFVLAVVAAEWIGLYYLQALGASHVSKDLDVVVTALAIGGGTKPLHDGIKRIERAKEGPPAAA